eukprot:3292371-Amphidinium_carterae.2
MFVQPCSRYAITALLAAGIRRVQPGCANCREAVDGATRVMLWLLMLPGKLCKLPKGLTEDRHRGNEKRMRIHQRCDQDTPIVGITLFSSRALGASARRDASLCESQQARQEATQFNLTPLRWAAKTVGKRGSGKVGNSMFADSEISTVKDCRISGGCALCKVVGFCSLPKYIIMLPPLPVIALQLNSLDLCAARVDLETLDLLLDCTETAAYVTCSHVATQVLYSFPWQLCCQYTLNVRVIRCGQRQQVGQMITIQVCPMQGCGYRNHVPHHVSLLVIGVAWSLSLSLCLMLSLLDASAFCSCARACVRLCDHPSPASSASLGRYKVCQVAPEDREAALEFEKCAFVLIECWGLVDQRASITACCSSNSRRKRRSRPNVTFVRFQVQRCHGWLVNLIRLEGRSDGLVVLACGTFLYV